MGRVFLGVTNQIQFPVVPTKIANPENASPHSEWSLNTTYLYGSGMRQVPLSAPDRSGNTCRFVQESAPQGQKLVMWLADRLGTMPDLPAIEPNTSQQVLLDWKITSTIPMLMPDGVNIRIVVTGFYLYGLAQPLTPTQGLPIGTAPTDTVGRSQYVINQNNFKPTF